MVCNAFKGAGVLLTIADLVFNEATVSFKNVITFYKMILVLYVQSKVNE